MQQKNSIDTALRIARACGGGVERKKYAKGGGISGPLEGITGGRSDRIEVPVMSGAHIIPADIVSAIGEGNSARGHDLLSKTFAKSIETRKPLKPKGGKSAKMKDGGTVGIRVSDGEFIVSPEDVAKVGNGDTELGHELLNQFIVDARQRTIAALRKIGNPK